MGLSTEVGIVFVYDSRVSRVSRVRHEQDAWQAICAYHLGGEYTQPCRTLIEGHGARR